MTMPVKFLHTADWQIGKPFAGIADNTKRVLVQQERLNVLSRIGEAAVKHGAEFIVVSGDLFDSPSPTKEDVAAVCSAIGKLGIPVLTIPGNHDHGGPGGVWGQRFFLDQQSALAPKLRPLLTAEPIELENAVIFPCPLLRRHEADDTTAWLRAPDLDLARFGDKLRIVLAHGSVQGFATENDEEDVGGSHANRIDLDHLSENKFDYIALGDWHGTKKITDRAWYSGTPEIDRFPKGVENRPGNVLAVEAARGMAPVVTEIRTARLNWLSHSFTFSGDESLNTLATDIEKLIGNRAQEDLLVLELAGSLGIAASVQLESLLDGWRARLLRIKLADGTTIAPTQAEVAALIERAGDPLISRVAKRLIAEECMGGEAKEIARIALRELYAACQP